MSNHSTLDYAFIRTEADAKYTLFLKIDPSLLEQEVDINLNRSKQLVLEFQTGQVLTTDELPDDIHYNLANRMTLTIFTDEDGTFIANHILDPLGVQ